jgi:hypothetical protein
MDGTMVDAGTADWFAMEFNVFSTKRDSPNQSI